MRSKQMYLFFAECLLKKREGKHVMGENRFRKTYKKGETRLSSDFTPKV